MKLVNEVKFLMEIQRDIRKICGADLSVFVEI
jgi:hypothetical protein